MGKFPSSPDVNRRRGGAPKDSRRLANRSAGALANLSAAAPLGAPQGAGEGHTPRDAVLGAGLGDPAEPLQSQTALEQQRRQLMAGSSRRAVAVRGLLESGLRPRCKNGARTGLPHCRHLSSNRILASQVLKTCPPLASGSTMKQPARPFLNLAAPLLGGAKRIEYAEAHQLPYSVEQMYDIVADVGSYRLFVPWCTGSTVLSGRNGFSQAQLEVGFPPVLERYVSEISMVPHRQIRAVSKDGRLFQHLETLWQFGPGLSGQLDTCTLKFYVSFEFKSALHSKLANLFFDEVVKQMVSAFERRAEKLYGRQAAIRQHKAVCCT